MAIKVWKFETLNSSLLDVFENGIGKPVTDNGEVTKSYRALLPKMILSLQWMVISL